MKNNNDTIKILFGDYIDEALIAVGTPLYDENDIKSI
jgi:hypothetical protein